MKKLIVFLVLFFTLTYSLSTSAHEKSFRFEVTNTILPSKMLEQPEWPARLRIGVAIDLSDKELNSKSVSTDHQLDIPCA